MDLVTRYLAYCTDTIGTVFSYLVPNPVQLQIQAAEEREKALERLISHYGEVHPEFHQGSLQQALRDAQAEHKFLVVVFHSAEHEDSRAFCSQVLFNNPPLNEFVAQGFMVWYGDVHTLEASKAMSVFNVTTFPYVSVLSCASRPRVLVNLMGRFSGDELLANLVSVVDEHGVEQDNHRAQVAQNIENRQIMTEQRSEYEEALLADQERERQREAERAAREAAEEAAREEEERRLREAEERRQELERLKESLSAEPEAGPEVVELAVRLPNGKSVVRRFAKAEPLQNVYTFVEVEASKLALDLGSYSLVDFRRKQFSDKQASVADAGIEGNSRLLVHQL